jgi:SAM-dependent methyltransferase
MFRVNQFLISDAEKGRLAEKARSDAGIFESYVRFIRDHFGDRKDLQVLEIGCGFYEQMPILFQSFGFSAVGIDDFSLVHRSDKLSSRCQNYLRKRFYYSRLRKAAGRRLQKGKAVVMNADALSMPFGDETFDIVFSDAVFEHLMDVPQAVSELCRVLKRGGWAYIGIHLFASLSGSHHPRLQQTVAALPEGVEPWYHLRGLPGEILPELNRYREDDYRACFGKMFEIEQEMSPDTMEGEPFLTEEILRELKDYTREELLKRWIVFVLKKR